MDLPNLATRVTLPPPNPLRDRQLDLLEQLVVAGPERFDLTSVFSTVEGDNVIVDPEEHTNYPLTVSDIISNMGSGMFDNRDDVADLLVNSLTFGTCGRTACLGGHAQIIHYRRTKQWISFSEAQRECDLPEPTIAMSVYEEHPFHSTYSWLLDNGFDTEYAEWLVSIMVVRGLVDGTVEGQLAREERIADELEREYENPDTDSGY